MKPLYLVLLKKCSHLEQYICYFKTKQKREKYNESCGNENNNLLLAIGVFFIMEIQYLLTFIDKDICIKMEVGSFSCYLTKNISGSANVGSKKLQFCSY